jgi:alpha-beta hydrolase superfamily lysophospholipase
MELDVPYGDHPRERYDVFSPHEKSKGTVVFLHGGKKIKKKY